MRPFSRPTELTLGIAAVLLAAACAPRAALRSAPAAPPSPDLLPLLRELVAFPTVAGDSAADSAQRRWLVAAAARFGFGFRDAGTVLEIELPGPAGAPVLGLVVHGDVVPADAAGWSQPPFAATLVGDTVYGRGVVDDKGPLVQALLAMRALRDGGRARRASVRLLVGTDEESGSLDIQAYLKSNRPPDFSLVLDSSFPLVVGEKAWHELTVSAPAAAPQGIDRPWVVESASAGLATSIVPDRAEVVLRWRGGAPDWSDLVARLRARALPDGVHGDLVVDGERLRLATRGRAAHAGMAIGRGRNALVGMAAWLDGELAAGPHAHLLEFARRAGRDLHGGGLGLETARDPLWGTYDVNVATLMLAGAQLDTLRLAINVRRIPPRPRQDLEAHLRGVVARFAAERGAGLGFGGHFLDELFVADPRCPGVQRLLDLYRRASGRADGPQVVGGGTYAKRLPNAIAFGTWFPDRPYPGHDADERIAVADLQRGLRVLEAVLEDLVCSAAPLPEVRLIQ